jgi:predicted thioesterase
MRQIPLAAKGSFNLLVQREHLANRFKDAILPPVFATPVMIMVMESAALNAMRAYLDPGESAVGTTVNVRHLVATPVGRPVSGEAEVTKVDGRDGLKFRDGQPVRRIDCVASLKRWMVRDSSGQTLSTSVDEMTGATTRTFRSL